MPEPFAIAVFRVFGDPLALRIEAGGHGVANEFEEGLAALEELIGMAQVVMIHIGLEHSDLGHDDVFGPYGHRGAQAHHLPAQWRWAPCGGPAGEPCIGGQAHHGFPDARQERFGLQSGRIRPDGRGDVLDEGSVHLVMDQDIQGRNRFPGSPGQRDVCQPGGAPAEGVFGRRGGNR